jgi:subtilisin-like proprotein convertase family protein
MIYDKYINHPSIDYRDYKLFEDIKLLYLADSYSKYKIYYNEKENKVTVSDLRKDGFGTLEFTSIDKITFKDIGSVSVKTTFPLPVEDVIPITDKGKAIISTEDILKNDLSFRNQTIEVDSVLEPIGCKVNLVDNTKIEVNLDPKYKGFVSFKYLAKISGYISDTPTPVYLRNPDLPTDQYFFKQWPLNDTKVIAAWDYGYTGQGINIAIPDSGFIPPHPDLKVNDEWGYNPLLESSHNIVTHALSVAGVIGAKKNTNDLVGVAYNANLTNFQYIGTGSFSNSNYNFAFQYDIISNSYTLNIAQADPSKYIEWINVKEAISTTLPSFAKVAEEGRNGLGSTVLFASPNDYQKGVASNYNIYTNSPYAITVGGINKQELLLDNYIIPFASPGSNILVSAPASHFPVLDVDKMFIKGNSVEYSYTINYAQGNSFATPLVAGCVALMYEANLQLGYRDVQEILAVSATKLPDELNLAGEWTINGAKYWNGGGLHYNLQYGYGQVNAEAAVLLAESWPYKQTYNNLISIQAAISKDNPVQLHPSESINIDYKINRDLIVEYAEINIKQVGNSLNNIVLSLISPSNTSYPFFQGPMLKQENAYLQNIFTQDIGIVGFRGEYAKGVWKIKADYHMPNQQDTRDFPTITMNSFKINLFGKEVKDHKQLVYTDEFMWGGDEPHQIPTDYNILNLAAITSDLIIDLTGKQSSTIAGIPVAFAHGHNITHVIGGTGNDSLIGRGTFWPGRGNDTVVLEEGNSVIEYRALDKHIGHDHIYNFAIGATKLKFKREVKFADIAKFIQHNQTHYESYYDKREESCVDSILIKGEDWSITLIGKDLTDFSEKDIG